MVCPSCWHSSRPPFDYDPWHPPCHPPNQCQALPIQSHSDQPWKRESQNHIRSSVKGQKLMTFPLSFNISGKFFFIITTTATRLSVSERIRVIPHTGANSPNYWTKTQFFPSVYHAWIEEAKVFWIVLWYCRLFALAWYWCNTEIMHEWWYFTLAMEMEKSFIHFELSRKFRICFASRVRCHFW